MNVEVHSAATLPQSLVQQWTRIQESNPALASPCFSPELLMAVGSEVSSAQVGVEYRGAEPVAFFPFARGRFGIGTRVKLCDYQGVIARPDHAIDPVALLRGCDLVAWDFDHLLAAQGAFRPFHERLTESPIVDLSGGLESYWTRQSERGFHVMKTVQRAAQKLEREVGPLRFEPSVSDPGQLQQLLAWQEGRYGVGEAPQEQKLRILLRLLQIRQPHFRGVLSVLYAGDEMAAAHFGLQGRSTWHGWFSAFDRRFEKCSPGILLLWQMIEAAPQMDMRAIDLGKGGQLYKRRFMNGSVALAEGSVEVPSLVSALRRTRRAAERWIRQTPAVLKPARALLNVARRSPERVNHSSRSPAQPHPPQGTGPASRS